MTDQNTPATTRYEVTILEDGDDLILPFPQPMLDELGWREGDILEWTLDESTGQYIISKKT